MYRFINGTFTATGRTVSPTGSGASFISGTTSPIVSMILHRINLQAEDDATATSGTSTCFVDGPIKKAGDGRWNNLGSTNPLLKQTDYDGHFSSSTLVSFDLPNHPSIRLYPNPVHQSENTFLTLDGLSQGAEVMVRISSLQGILTTTHS